MRIVYLLPDPGIGLFGTKGASVHAQEMIRALRGLGHEVIACCTKRGDRAGEPQSEAVPADLRDLPVFTVPVTGKKGAALREQAVAETAEQMATLMADQPIDLIYERYSLFSSAGAQLTAATGAPLVLEVNAPLLEEQRTHRSLHNEAAAAAASATSFAAATLISCVSAPVADWVNTHLPHGDQPRVIITPNGVDPDRFKPSSSSSLQETAASANDLPESQDPRRQRDQKQGLQAAFTVGFLGTLKPWHGTETLLEALAMIPASERAGWRCEIIGDGPERSHLQRHVEEMGIQDLVHFLGAIAPAQVPAALAGWDTAVAPYPEPAEDSAHYFSPLKVYEYLAAGLPVVASDVGELPQVIHNGGNGLLVPGSDPSSLAGTLRRLAADAQLRSQLGAAARASAVTEHSWTSRATAVLAAAQRVSSGEHGIAAPHPAPRHQPMQEVQH